MRCLEKGMAAAVVVVFITLTTALKTGKQNKNKNTKRTKTEKNKTHRNVSHFYQ